MKTWLLLALSILCIVACAPIAEPEAPPQPVPTSRPPRREPLPPAPSDTPPIVYASASSVKLRQLLRPEAID